MKRTAFWLAGILAVAVGWRVIILALDVVPFNSDEAIVGLMARHILQGQGIPVYFYGQSYMGSLDALLVAAGFALFGQEVWVIRAVQILLFAGLLATTVWLGKEAFGKVEVGLIAAGLLAIPTVNLTLYSTISLGGYGEALLIGNGLLITAVRLNRRYRPIQTVVFGFLAGLGLWANALTLVFTLPALLYLVFSFRGRLAPAEWARAAGLVVLGGLFGAAPVLIHTIQHGLTAQFAEILGSAVSVEGGSYFQRVLDHLVNLLLFGAPAIFGFRPPWGVIWLALPLLPFALIAWMMVLIHAGRGLVGRGGYGLLAGVIGVCLAGFLFTSFGVDPSGRYFLPMAVPLALLAGEFLWTGDAPQQIRIGAIAILLVYQAWGNIQCALTYPPGFTSQFDKTTIIEHRYDDELIRFLEENDITHGYSQYWVAYPLAFNSGETLIFPPRLPYKEDMRYTARDNRYAPYNLLADDSQQVAYITAGQPVLDEQLEMALENAGIRWEEERIGDYHVFYDLSAPVQPEELGLDFLTSPKD